MFQGFRSLTTRMIVWVLVASGAVFLTAAAVSSSLSRSAAVRAAEQEAFNAAEAARNRMLVVLSSVERSTELLGASIETLQPSAPVLNELLGRFVLGNPNVYGSTASFEPFAFDAGREHVAPYFYRDAKDRTHLASADLATPTYRYWERDWYRLPMGTGQPRWSEPYFDDEGGDTLMLTYTVPVRKTGTSAITGVVTADLQLDWLRQFIADVQIGQHGYGVVLSREGRVIAHPDASLLAIRATDAVSAQARERLQPLVGRALAGTGRFEPVTIDGREYRAVFRPIDTGTGWTLAALYPEDELMAGATRLSWIQAAVAIAGLALLALVVVGLSRRLTAPIQGLAERARQLATGDLDLELPPVTSRDELGTLTEAFHHMRDALREHIRTLRDTTAAKERLESELKLAHRIQMGMLPRGRVGGPDEGFEVAAHLVPARAVGGDLYVHLIEDGRAMFMLGDVSGKGVAAALFMARTKTLFDALAPRLRDPGALLAELNHQLCAENEHGMFVTAVCGVLDPKTGDLTYASAGHDAPLRVRADRRAEPLPGEGGPLLGLFDPASYPVSHDRLEPGECVLTFTDGVTDAMDTGGTMFGPDRLLEAVSVARSTDAHSLTQSVVAVVQDFSRGAPQSDDITVLTVRYLGSRLERIGAPDAT